MLTLLKITIAMIIKITIVMHNNCNDNKIKNEILVEVILNMTLLSELY